MTSRDLLQSAGLLSMALMWPNCAGLEKLDDWIDLPYTDCNVRAEEYSDPKMTCTLASSYKGACIPASDFKQWGCLELDSDATLCEDGEPFVMSVYLTTNNVKFEGNGQTLAPGPGKQSGVVARVEHSISDVDISNCTILNSPKYGVQLKRFFRGEELQEPTRPELKSSWMKGHSGIRLHHVDIIRPRQTGIYVGQNSEDFVFEDGTIDGGYSGIYLEAGSVRSRISRAIIKNSHEREGISLDSSQYNVIEDSTFSNNGKGRHAVNLYKNCGETKGQVCPIERKLSASHNTLRNNTLDGDIYVAWRQLKPSALTHCVDIDLAGNWRDHAENNHFEGNRFLGKHDLIVKDGPIFIENGNRFDGGYIKLGEQAPVGDVPILISGRIVGNVFGDPTPIQFNDTKEQFNMLEILDNRRTNGRCLSSPNSCNDQRR